MVYFIGWAVIAFLLILFFRGAFSKKDEPKD